MHISHIVHNMRPGVERRKEILKYLRENEDNTISINRKWCAQLKYDNDLKYLIKKNILKQIRSYTHSTCAHSYLKLVSKT